MLLMTIAIRLMASWDATGILSRGVSVTPDYSTHLSSVPQGRPKSPGEDSASAGEGHCRVRGPSYRCPSFLEYSGKTSNETSPGEAAASEWAPSQEVVNNNIGGLEANTTHFSYRIRIARGEKSV